jgi:serine/threonine-protein kinase
VADLPAPQPPFGGRYRIERELGSGGMATVYLAHDVRHGRDVALKVLRPELAALLGDRFHREVETTARLQHPHILPLFDSGEADGRLFYVMPRVADGSLRDRLDREGRLPIAEAVRLVREAASALDHAHTRGILHRDVKPENILLSGGHVLVADFGIARILDQQGGDRLTETGMALGTPAYMSPEQALGEEVGPAADQYALGCLAFEMIAGVVPFTGANARALLARRLIEDPPSLATLVEGVPDHLARAVTRALAREAGGRFASVAAFADALVTPTLPLAPAPTAPVAPERSVTVLEFVNMSGNASHDWLSTGIAETVAVDLQRVSGVRVIPAGPKTETITGPRATEVGRALGARWVVSGAFQVAGNRIRITPQFHDTGAGTILGATKLDGNLDDVFVLQDRIVAELLRTIDVAPTAGEVDEIERPETAEIEAYRSYASGRQCFNRFGDKAFVEAVGHFERAIAVDPGYALAHAGLGSIHVFRFIATTDPADLTAGITRLARAVELDPDRAEPHQWLAYAYTRANRLEEAVAAGVRATTLEPENALAHYFLAVARCVLADQRRDYDQLLAAAENFRASIAAEPAYLMSHSGLTMLYLNAGQYEDARRVLDESTVLERSGRPRGPVILGAAAFASLRLALREGRVDDAEREVGDLLHRLERTEHVYTSLYQGLTLLARAELAARRSAWDRAVADCLHARELAERHQRRLGMGHLYLRAELGLAKAQLGLGDRREATRHFEAARAVFEHPGDWDLGWGFELSEATDWIEIASYHAAAGDAPRAAAAIGEAVDRGWGDFRSLEHDPAFATVGRHPLLEPLRRCVESRPPIPGNSVGGR